MEIGRLLVGTDGSDSAADAVALAAAQAAKLRAELVVAFVAYEPRLYSTTVQVLEDETAFVESAARPARDQATEICAAAGVDFQWVQELSTTTVADKLLDVAAGRNIDLVVVGQRGLGAAGRFFLGSVSNKLSHISDLPVLIVAGRERGERGDAPTSEIARVAIATDGSEDAIVAADIGLSVALANDATVSVIHVEEPPPLGFFALFPIPDQVQDLTDRQKDVSFAAVAPMVEAAGVAAQRIVLRGHPADAILDYATDHDIDLIVLGHRGLTAIRRFLMGSVASKVLQNTRVHMLLGPVPAASE